MKKNLDPNKLLSGIKKEVTKNEKPDLTTVDSIVKKIHEKSACDKGSQTLPDDETRRTTLDFPKELHKKIQIRAVEKDLTMKDYLVGLVIKDLEQ